MKKIRKQIMLLTLTLLLLLLACSTVSAAAASNNSNTQLSSNTSNDNNSTGVNTSNSSSEIVISGKVTKCSNGNDFSGVTVTASKNGVKLASTTTKSDGTYVLSFQSNNTTFTVTASYPGHTSSSKTVSIKNGTGTASFQLGADNVYVSTTGSDTTGDGTQTKPYATISKAFTEVNAGGTIHLTAGTYTGTGNVGLTITKNVNIIGENPTSTIINAQSSTNIFTINSGVTVSLENLTLSKGTTKNYGGAITNYGTITLSGCNFTNNNATYGGAIYNSGTITSLSSCNFTNNNATNGGAIYNGNTITSLNGCNFTNNNATTYGGAIYNGNTITSLNGCIFTGNAAIDDIHGHGGAIYNGNTITSLSSCNFTNNNATYGGAITNYGTITLSGCNFTNNNATRGGAIYNMGGDSCIVHFSSFVNNTATKGNAIYRLSGSVNATYNWWGSNSRPSSQVYGSVTYSPWLYMTITVDPSSINYGGTCNVRVSFNNAYDGTIISSIDPAGGHILDGTIVSFSSTLGTFNPKTTTTTTNGTTVTTFTSTSTGAGVINTTTDNQKVSVSININTINTTLTVNNVTSYNGKTVNLTATLKDSEGNPLTGKTITFKVNGVTAGTATTNEYGIATYQYIITQTAGTYTITASFVDGTIYTNSTSTGNLTVNTITTNLTVNNATGIHGGKVNLTATLKDENGNPLTSKTITFTVNGNNYTATTNGNGIATYEYTITQNAGIYTVNASFVDGTIYTNSTSTGNLTVNTITTNLTVNTITGVHGGKVNLTATLKDENGNPLTSKTITFKVNGDTVGTATTDENGTATYEYTIRQTAGVYTIKASFVDGTIYTNCTGTGSLTVKPTANIYIKTTANNSNPTVGETFKLTYKLGNYGPDAAENVKITFKIPDGLEFVNASVDSGKWTYDNSTRTVTWIFDSLEVGDPYLYVTVKAAGDGTHKITPNITTTTYNLNTGDSGIITINVQKGNNNSNNGNSTNTVNAATKTTIGLHDTGLPLNYLLLAVLMVLSGLIPKRK